jgi:hypothetical protein
MPGITNIHVNATLRLSSDKKSAQFDEADDSQESLKHQSKDVRAMIFDMRRKTFNAETNHYNYGNHVPQKNLLTQGVGIKNFRKTGLAKNYKSSTIVNMPIPLSPQAQMMNVEQLDVPFEQNKRKN